MTLNYTRLFLRDSRALLAWMRRLDTAATIAGGSGTGGRETGTGASVTEASVTGETAESSKLEIARVLHSVKSGAAFLGWFDLEKIAHDLETVLSKSDFSSYNWSEAARELERLIKEHETSLAVESKTPSCSARQVRFSHLEKRILEESKKRDESFYRLSCRISPSEPLPYPRAYLLANNLEKTMTLVRSEPPMNDADADFSQVCFWFTTELNEAAIYGAANVDLVEVLELIRIDYGNSDDLDGVPDRAYFSSPIQDDTTLIVNHNLYTETVQVAEELAWRLEDRVGSPEAALSLELRRSLEALAYSPIEPLLNEIGSAVSRLAERRGLLAKFNYQAESMGLDAGTLETLGELLRQLVRNSLCHGIETPQQRLNSGKNEFGLLNLEVRRAGSRYLFSFQDDGRGIDEEEVFERARKEAIDVADKNLLDILCLPGFSTTEEPELDGGRGLGLPMMRQLILSEYKSQLELKNSPGKGLKLSWSVPERLMRRPFLVFMSDGRRWAIPSHCISRRDAMDPEKITAAGQSYRIGDRNLPMVGPLGLCRPGTKKAYVLEIQHRRRRAALLVDDLLSEEPWGSEDLVPADPVGPWGRSLEDAKQRIPILTPALVYAGDSPLSGAEAPTDV